MLQDDTRSLQYQVNFDGFNVNTTVHLIHSYVQLFQLLM